MPSNNRLKEVAKLFFKLGCFAFGGPAAHIAMMEDEVVEKRKWMTREHFLDLIGATNLIPGPNSTEMTMHCGYERAGKAGLFVAGICFIFPAVLITGVLGYFYVEYGQLPQVEPFLYGIKPAVLAVILGAILKLQKKAIKSYELLVLGLVALALCLIGVNEIVALFVTGIIGVIAFSLVKGASTSFKSLLPLGLVKLPVLTVGLKTSSVFFTFLKVGAILFGSGYVLFAYLDAELVANGIMSRQELLDAIAVGQFTPGPVLSTATFIGYQLNGFWGAIAASAGIFLPSFIFVLILNPLVSKLRSSKILSYFLDSVNVAALAVMAAVLIQMGMDVLVDWKSIAIALISVALFFGSKKINAMWIIAIGAALGYLLLLF